MPDDTPSDYEVGYGKPPVKNRFKPGQKRPPRKATPKPSLRAPQRYADIMRKLLMEPMTVSRNGKPVRLRTCEVLIRRLVERAGKEAGASRLLHQFREFLDDGLPEPGSVVEVWINGVNGGPLDKSAG